MLCSSLVLVLEMETSKFTTEAMGFLCFSNPLNPRAELIKQVPGDCPILSENLWAGFIQSTQTHVWMVVGFTHVCAMCVLCVYRCIYINSHLSIELQALS